VLVGGLELSDVGRCLDQHVRELQCVLAAQLAVADTVVLDAYGPADKVLAAR
jgi:hypothetical protein